MHFAICKNPSLIASECLVLGLFANEPLPQFIETFAEPHQKLIKTLHAKMADSADMLWQSDVDGHALLIVNCGESTTYSVSNLIKRCKEIADGLIKQRIRKALICLPPVKELSPEKQIEHMLLTFSGQHYQFIDFKSKQKKPHALESLEFYLPEANDALIENAVAISEGMEFSRTLANLPANVCTPSYLASQAMELADEYSSLHATILEKSDLEEMGMGAFLAVAKGSIEPPKLVELQYNGASDTAPIILVGKGITFDSGGLSIKPADAMTEMKYDMCGAATVLGILKTVALLNLPINLIGLIACAENMPSGSAVKPGDVVHSLSGQTIEILNTDAEGRLVLADALTYAERFKPRMVLDIATLTGAMVVALGSVYTGFLTKDDELAALIEQAAKESCDKAWRLPLDEDYREAMDSPVADMLNASFDRSAGSITAASFLSRFTEKYPWAHLDIAGTAWVSGKQRNATGRPLSLIVELLRHVAAR